MVLLFLFVWGSCVWGSHMVFLDFVLLSIEWKYLNFFLFFFFLFFFSCASLVTQFLYARSYATENDINLDEFSGYDTPPRPAVALIL